MQSDLLSQPTSQPNGLMFALVLPREAASLGFDCEDSPRMPEALVDKIKGGKERTRLQKLWTN